MAPLVNLSDSVATVSDAPREPDFVVAHADHAGRKLAVLETATGGTPSRYLARETRGKYKRTARLADIAAAMDAGLI